MKTAMREWEKYTCIKFREKTSSDVNYVRIQNGHGWGFFSWWKKEIDLWHGRDCNSWRIIKVKTLFTFRCNSQLGMVGGEQILNLDINGCRWVKQTFLPVIWTTIPLLNHITIYELFFGTVLKNFSKPHQTLISNRQCKPSIFENVEKVSLQ